MALSARDQVRLLIADTDPVIANRLFADADLDAFLAMEGDSVKLAAAQALDVMGTNEVMVQKVITLLDLETDGAAVSRELRQRAKSLRDQEMETDAIAFDTAELVVDENTQYGRLWNERLRNLS